MKKMIPLLLAFAMLFSLCACGGGSDTTTADDDAPTNIETSTAGSDGTENEDTNNSQEATVPNNGEWDEILSSGDDYYLVKKEIDSYDGYKIMLGVVDDKGEWIQELTETGAFVEGVQFRAMGSSETLRDSACYMYLGEGVFLASPGASVFSHDEEYRIGSWENSVSYSPTGRAEVSIWECLIWNVIDNSQQKFDASKLSVFQDGYLLFCEEDEYGGGMLSAMNTRGEIVKLPCKFLPNKPAHNFPIYAEDVFFASTENSKPGFFDIEGNMVIDLSDYEMGRIPYSNEFGVNAPYFESGEATILTVNNGGSVFSVTIDKMGAVIGEPQKTDITVI